MQKNDEILVTIENLGANGEGVAYYDNLPIFIPFCLPNEVVKAKVIKVLKNFAYAKKIDIVSISSDRVNALCPVFEKCGGCQLQHLSYEGQLKFKKDLVKTNLKKFGNINCKVDDCFPSNNQYGYRNKLQLPVGEIVEKNGETLDKKKVVGFYATASHRIVPISHCPLENSNLNKLVCIVLTYLEKSDNSVYNEITKQGNIRHIVARCIDDKLMLVIVSKTGKLSNQELLISLLKEHLENFSLYVNKNSRQNNVILGEEFKLIYGNATQKISTFGIEYKVSPQSFMQVNFYIQDKIYQTVVDNIDKNETVINAYSGAGLLSAIISQKAKKVYGVEIIKQANIDADNLAKDNNIKNMENICGDCAVEIPKLVKNIEAKNCTIVLDPPRKGCHQNVLESIKTVCPEKILYISCNSATLARDIKILMQDNNYKIKFIKPFDMFPQTCHIETLLCLEKNKS